MPTSLTVHLIRHAESRENELIKGFKSGMVGWSSLAILNIPALIDSPLSTLGFQQTEALAAFSERTTFVPSLLAGSSGTLHVIHSPLRRARQTCYAVAGCVAPRSQTPGTMAVTANTSDDYDPTAAGIEPPDDRITVVQSDNLLEKTPMEWLPLYGESRLSARITAFSAALEMNVASSDAVVVVGHSQYFKKMVGAEEKMGNCDVVRARYTFEDSRRGDGAGRWEIEEELYKGTQGVTQICEQEVKVSE